MDEQLTDRKKRILKAIIRTYMETGEPVGSRTISKDKDLNVSSATIRNEMSDLTEMGYIVQPHTSAGRIPSDKGYRLYVDELMREKEDEIEELRNLMIEKTDKMDKVLKKVARVLASNTNYATMISVPQYSGSKLKFIQLSRVNELQLVAVVVLDAVAATIHVDEDDMEIYTSGATNFFKYPELSDTTKATGLISTFEEKQQLVDLVKERMADDSTGVQVYIGDELPISTMKDRNEWIMRMW